MVSRRTNFGERSVPASDGSYLTLSGPHSREGARLRVAKPVYLCARAA